MQPDGCHKCPLLDLGTVYPPKDERDPWRRMPELFKLAVSVFGTPMYRHGTKPRDRAEKLLGHYCAIQRTKYGLCTEQRIPICHGIVGDALKHGATGSTIHEKHQFAQAALKRAVNSDETDALLKPTRTALSSANLVMPPITLRRMPAA